MVGHSLKKYISFSDLRIALLNHDIIQKWSKNCLMLGISKNMKKLTQDFFLTFPKFNIPKQKS